MLEEPVELLRLLILADLATPPEKDTPAPETPAPTITNLSMEPVDPGFPRS